MDALRAISESKTPYALRRLMPGRSAIIAPEHAVTVGTAPRTPLNQQVRCQGGAIVLLGVRAACVRDVLVGTALSIATIQGIGVPRI
jgi:hypothetical protein